MVTTGFPQGLNDPADTALALMELERQATSGPAKDAMYVQRLVLPAAQEAVSMICQRRGKAEAIGRVPSWFGAMVGSLVSEALVACPKDFREQCISRIVEDFQDQFRLVAVRVFAVADGTKDEAAVATELARIKERRNASGRPDAKLAE
jgi:hypothetical protein